MYIGLIIVGVAVVIVVLYLAFCAVMWALVNAFQLAEKRIFH